MPETVYRQSLKLGSENYHHETIAPLTETISLYKKFGFIELPPKEVNSQVDQLNVLILQKVYIQAFPSPTSD